MSTPGAKARGLDALGALKQTLRQARHEAAAAAERQREQTARAARERDLFAHTVGTVVPLRIGSAVHVIAPPRPPSEPRQSQRDEAAVMAQALSDEFDVDSLLDTDDSLSFRRRGIGSDVVRKLRRGVWVVQGQIDLHGLRRDQARERLSVFLHEAQRDGLRCLRVIHGKGNGSPGREPVLKAKVRSWLAQRDAVIAFTQARAAEGGAGALIVLLASTKLARGAGGTTRALR